MKRSLFVCMMLAVVSFPALATENDTDKAETPAASQTASSDEMAADLNAQQSIRQTFMPSARPRRGNPSQRLSAHLLIGNS